MSRIHYLLAVRPQYTVEGKKCNLCLLRFVFKVVGNVQARRPTLQTAPQFTKHGTEKSQLGNM